MSVVQDRTTFVEDWKDEGGETGSSRIADEKVR